MGRHLARLTPARPQTRKGPALSRGPLICPEWKLFLTEQREQVLRVAVGNRERLDTQLLLCLERLQSR